MVSGRSCQIEIENQCANYTFGNPRMFIKSGFCATSLPPTVAPGATGIAEFRKKSDTATGCVGVFTYDLQNKDTKQAAEKIGVLFSAPYDRNLYHNLYAVGVFAQSTHCDNDLYNLMYYGNDTRLSRQQADGSPLFYKGVHITIKGTMSDTQEPVIKVQVSQNRK